MHGGQIQIDFRTKIINTAAVNMVHALLTRIRVESLYIKIGPLASTKNVFRVDTSWEKSTRRQRISGIQVSSS